MKVIETAKATDVIAEYFDLICDTDYSFDETEILRRMNANAVDAISIEFIEKYTKTLASATIYSHNISYSEFAAYMIGKMIEDWRKEHDPAN